MILVLQLVALVEELPQLIEEYGVGKIKSAIFMIVVEIRIFIFAVHILSL